MQTMPSTYRGLRLLIDLYWDRGFALVTLVSALVFAAWLGSQ